MARYDRIYLSNFRNAFPEKGHARISSSSSYICHLKLKLFLPLVQWCIIGLSIEKFVLIQPDLTALPLWACFNVASSVKFKLFFVAPTHSSSVWRSFSLLVHPVSWAFSFFFSFRKTFYTCRRSRILLSHCFSHIINGHSQYFQAAVAGLQTAENAATLTRSQKGNAVSCPRWSCLRQTFPIVTPATQFLRLLLCTCFYPPTHNAVNFLIVFTGREKIAPLVQITPRLFRTFS